jgi:hypothetical protein
MTGLRSLTLLLAVVVSLIACGGPSGHRGASSVLDPSAVTLTHIVPPSRVQPASLQGVHTTATTIRETHRMCDLRAGKGSC